MDIVDELISLITERIEYKEIPDTCDDDIGMNDIEVSVGEWRYEPQMRCEPEDAIWGRDLGTLFGRGVEVGIRAAIEYFKIVELC